MNIRKVYGYTKGEDVIRVRLRLVLNINVSVNEGNGCMLSYQEGVLCCCVVIDDDK